MGIGHLSLTRTVSHHKRGMMDRCCMWFLFSSNLLKPKEDIYTCKTTIIWIWKLVRSFYNLIARIRCWFKFKRELALFWTMFITGKQRQCVTEQEHLKNSLRRSFLRRTFFILKRHSVPLATTNVKLDCVRRFCSSVSHTSDSFTPLNIFKEKWCRCSVVQFKNK